MALGPVAVRSDLRNIAIIAPNKIDRTDARAKRTARLAEVNANYDPDNAFHVNKKIQPGARAESGVTR